MEWAHFNWETSYTSARLNAATKATPTLNGHAFATHVAVRIWTVCSQFGFLIDRSDGVHKRSKECGIRKCLSENRDQKVLPRQRFFLEYLLKYKPWKCEDFVSHRAVKFQIYDFCVILRCIEDNLLKIIEIHMRPEYLGLSLRPVWRKLPTIYSCRICNHC